MDKSLYFKSESWDLKTIDKKSKIILFCKTLNDESCCVAVKDYMVSFWIELTREITTDKNISKDQYWTKQLASELHKEHIY